MFQPQINTDLPRQARARRVGTVSLCNKLPNTRKFPARRCSCFVFVGQLQQQFTDAAFEQVIRHSGFGL